MAQLLRFLAASKVLGVLLGLAGYPKMPWMIMASLKLLRLSNEKATKIADNPLIYKAAEFPDTRVAAMGHFTLFYKITDEEVGD